MLTGDDALLALESLIEKPEATRSSFWDVAVELFKVGADGAVDGPAGLGIVSRKTGSLRTAAHWISRRPFWYMGRKYPDFADSNRLGRLVARRQRRRYTEDIVRQVLSLALIRDTFSFAGDDDLSVVIGDGYGVMTVLLLLAYPARRVIVVNLTKSLLVDLIHVRQVVPEIRFAWVSTAADMEAALSCPGLNLIAVRADDARHISAAPIGLAVNTASMQEMTPPVIAEYFDVLRHSPGADTVFYCCNKLSKTLPDGTVVRFDDYPWRAADRILVDEPCAWQNIVSTKKPPFWYVKKNVVWHRLAVLEKDSA